jgi:vancomycin resistance protein YoaR
MTLTRSLFFSTLLIGSLWTATAPAALARTVSVKEIVRPPDEGKTQTIALDNTALDALSAGRRENDFFIAVKPLTTERLVLTREDRTTRRIPFSPKTAYTWLEQTVKDSQNTPEDARLVIENGRVTDFSPGTENLKTDLRETALALLSALQNNEGHVNLKGLAVEPPHTLASTNTLGINEFLAGGISDFSNSSKNRLANIEAGIQQVKGVIVKPGEVFSFGKYLGDVTAEKGFKPEIVIKAEGLKPELGGGICQVSSTLFRAVMQSGMQITQRRNHAFSVSHYFPPGTDATIYTPATDLRFINDTPAHVLIWPHYIDKTHLAFDLYGTKDSRSVVVDEPIQWDRKPDGSMKASWTRHVTKDGITRDDTLKSNYLPPALFKKEEKFVVVPPVPPTGTPDTTDIPPTQNPQTPTAPVH